MKRSVVALVAIAVVLAVAGPAAAKGAVPQSARITGPGLATPLRFGDPTAPGGTSAIPSLGLLEDETQFLQTIFGGGAPTAPPMGRASLGPRYTITWTMRRELATRKVFPVRSDLYPYAKGGPLMYTRGGQKVTDMDGGFVLRSGWSRARSVLLDNLQAWGMPKDHRQAAGKVASSAIAPVWAILVALAVMILVAAVKARRGNTPTPRG